MASNDVTGMLSSCLFSLKVYACTSSGTFLVVLFIRLVCWPPRITHNTMFTINLVVKSLNVLEPSHYYFDAIQAPLVLWNSLTEIGQW